MDINVNQQNYSVPESCSLQQMANTVLSQPGKGIAIAVNQQIIAKSEWATHLLKTGDNLIIIKATQGG